VVEVGAGDCLREEEELRDGLDFEPRREDDALDAGLGVDLAEPDCEEVLEALRDIGDEGRVEGRVEESLRGLKALADITLPLTIVFREGCNEGGKSSGVEGRLEAF